MATTEFTNNVTLTDADWFNDVDRVVYDILGDPANAAAARTSLAAAPSASPVFTGLVDISDSTAGQIKFPATQNASSNANTLDDYEEGTWTPSDGSGAGLSLTVTTARYTKIGRLVECEMDITYPSTASGATALISGLPFSSGSGNAGGGVCHYYSADINNPVGLGASATNINVYLGPSAATNSQLSTKIIRAVIKYSV